MKKTTWMATNTATARVLGHVGQTSGVCEMRLEVKRRIKFECILQACVYLLFGLFFELARKNGLKRSHEGVKAGTAANRARARPHDTPLDWH
jgi:hypothetical protein